MTRTQAVEILDELKDKYLDSEDEDDIDIGWALEFALADMDMVQEILNITKDVETD